jgi:AAA15 family ATPase/GTPase
MENINHYFQALPVPKSLQGDILDGEGKELSQLNHLNQFNVFIGQNNSGKSLLARELLKQNPESEYLDQSKVGIYNRQLLATYNSFENLFQGNEQKTLSGGSIKLTLVDLKDKFEEFDPLSSVFREHHKEVSDFFKKLERFRPQHFGHLGRSQLLSGNETTSIKDAITQIGSFFEKNTDSLFLKDGSFQRIYIPTTRTLRVFDDQELRFKKKIEAEYKFAESPAAPFFEDSIKVETGEEFYFQIYDLRNSGGEGEEKVESFQDFLSENFFENQVVKIYPIEKDRVVNIKIGSELEQPIYNLGDGLQMIIILSFFLFNHDGGLVVIEEPELFIHPGLQKKLVDLYCTHEKAKEFKFIVVTHSNHILEAALQKERVGIFSLTKYNSLKESKIGVLPKFVFENLEYGNNQFLESLGIQNTSVFLSNCTIWVEGFTDKLYLQKMVQEYLKDSKLGKKYIPVRELTEGVHYNWLLSSGDNIIHYDFSDEVAIDSLGHQAPVKYICGKSMVVVDADGGKNLARKKKLKKELGLRFLELPVIEIECLLPRNTIIKTVQSFNSWSTLEDSDVPEFTESNYSRKRLGSFIDNIVLQGKVGNGKKSFAVSSTGNNKSNLTLNCKGDFCRNSIANIDHTSLTESSKVVVRKILDFILANNSS